MKQLHPRAVWLFFIGYVFRLVVLSIFVALFTLFGYVEGSTVGSGQLLLWLLAIILVIFVIAYIVARLSYRFYRYELADIAFRKELGIIWKKYVSIPYDRIQNVDINRGVWARVLGLSDLWIQTAGMSGVPTTEGRLPGLSKVDAEEIRDELIRRARQSKNQGL